MKKAVKGFLFGMTAIVTVLMPMATGAAEEAESSLLAGAAKVCITPNDEIMEQQYNFDGNKVDGIYSDQFVRGLYIDNGENTALLLCFEYDWINVGGLKEAVSEATGIPVDNMLFSSTHNHTAAGGPDYGAFVIEKAIECANAARDAAVPAKYGYGEGKSYININRDRQQEEGYWMQDVNPEGYSDKTLAMMKLEDLEGNLIAIYMNYGMHNMACFNAADSDGVYKLSGNISGVTCDYIEDRYDGAVALWSIGAAGNQNPYIIASPTYYYDGYPEMVNLPDGASYALMELQGQQHAQDALRTMAGIACEKTEMPISFYHNTIELPAQKAPEGADMSMNRLLADNLVRKVTGATEIPERKLVVMEDDPEHPVQMNMELAVLGDIAFVGVPAEIYAEIGRDMKEASLFDNTVVVQFTDDNHCGYILDASSAGHDVFQSFGRVKPGEADQPIIEGMLEMEKEHLGEQ